MRKRCAIILAVASCCPKAQPGTPSSPRGQQTCPEECTLQSEDALRMVRMMDATVRAELRTPTHVAAYSALVVDCDRVDVYGKPAKIIEGSLQALSRSNVCVAVSYDTVQGMKLVGFFSRKDPVRPLVVFYVYYFEG